MEAQLIYPTCANQVLNAGFNGLVQANCRLHLLNSNKPATRKVFTKGLRNPLDERTQTGTAIRLQTEVPEGIEYNDAQSIHPAIPANRKDLVRRRNQITPCAAESIYELALLMFPQQATVLQNVEPEDYSKRALSLQATESVE